MKNKMIDIAIIGNGTIGTGTAYTLAKSDNNVSIALIGPSARTNAATTSAGAMLNCFAEVTTLSYTSPFVKAKLNMAIASNKLWPEWLKQFEHSASVPPVKLSFGTHVILNASNGGIDDENFVAIQTALDEFKVPYEKINPKTISGYDPICNFRALKALYLPEEAFCNSNAVLKTLDEAINHIQKINVYDTHAKTIKSIAGGFEIHTLDNKVIIAEQVLIAAGAFSQQFIDQFPEISAKIPSVLNSVGSAMQVKAEGINLKSVIRTPGRAGSCGLHMLPSLDGTLYVGATAYFARKPGTHIKLRYLYNLQKNAITQFNKHIENAEIINFYCGNRPVTIDTFPLLGKTSIKGLWIATGTYRDGFHNTPLLSQYLSSEMLSQAKIKLDHPFQPERKPLEIVNQKDSIQLTTRHLQAGFYEYGAEYPINGLNVENLYLEDVENTLIKLYEQLGTDYSLPVEVLVMLMRASEDEISHYKQIYQQFVK